MLQYLNAARIPSFLVFTQMLKAVKTDFTAAQCLLIQSWFHHVKQRGIPGTFHTGLKQGHISKQDQS